MHIERKLNLTVNCGDSIRARGYSQFTEGKLKILQSNYKADKVLKI